MGEGDKAPGADKTPSGGGGNAGGGTGGGGGSGSGLAAGTIAGVLAFVAGGVGTIVAAIGDFGSDDGAIAAARRNHVLLVVAAAATAALGLACGALYTIYKDRNVSLKFRGGMQVFGWFLICFAVLFLGIAAIAEDSLALWLTFALSAAVGTAIVLLFSGTRRLPAGVLFLTIGVLAIAAGVALGAIATSARAPGKPTIRVMREDPTTVRVQILGEGLASDVWYEASVRGYGELGPAFAPLAAARFSPGQDGKLDWSVRVNVADTDIGDKQPLKIGRLLVSVSRGNLDREAIKKYCVDVRFTCLSVRLPTTLDSGVVTTGVVTTGTTSTTTSTTSTTTTSKAATTTSGG